MTIFQLDTSGVVTLNKFDPEAYMGYPEHVNWDRLSPFAQGYVEALLRGLYENYEQQVAAYRFRFDNLAPETLARIIEDCATLERRAAYMVPTDAEQGAITWASRQRGDIADFPPLTLSLGDDGKVVFDG